jgi:hypothetical protein
MVTRTFAEVLKEKQATREARKQVLRNRATYKQGEKAPRHWYSVYNPFVMRQDPVYFNVWYLVSSLGYIEVVGNYETVLAHLRDCTPARCECCGGNENYCGCDQRSGRFCNEAYR